MTRVFTRRLPLDLLELEVRLQTILPENYRDRYEDVEPVSMGSAGLKYGDDGRVAWNEIWATFCDLAIAGGPPHKGTLLEPGSQAEIDAQPSRHRQVVEEICRGVALISGLKAAPSPIPGWVRVNCVNWVMNDWLVRAIAVENVSVRRCEDATLDLPAGPDYRVEKEIKNVITVVAKTSHYWNSHVSAIQLWSLQNLFFTMETESPLVQPAVLDPNAQSDIFQPLYSRMAETMHQTVGLRSSDRSYPGWYGVVCPDVRAAIWIMRMMVASNILSHREGTTVFLPVNPLSDPKGEAIVSSAIQIHGFAMKRKIL
jgi:sirohydrochlorin cobaltochelatase